MFALIIDPQGGASLPVIAGMAGALRGGATQAGIWHDEHGRAAVAAGVTGILPEDVFDRQPLVHDDLIFAAQARIGNRDEILDRLGLAAAQRTMLADSDVLHLAYRRWGEDCVQQLSGDYAFVAWHRDSGRVAAAVDHFGSVRLYYAQFAGKLVLATQLAALLAHPEVPRDLDFDALGFLIAPRIEPGKTSYRHVASLTGGHQLSLEGGVLRTRRWWNPDTQIRTRFRDSRDYVLHAREIFDRAVKACLRTSGGVAATVSGGLDSTLITATAALQLKESGRRLHAYTAVPEPGLPCRPLPGWESDDSSYAQALAQMHDNIDLQLVSPGGLCTLDVVPAFHARSRTPVRNSANHIWLGRIYEAAARGGARVVLIGAKGNATASQTGDGAFGVLFRKLRWGAALQLAANEAEDGGRAVWRAVVREFAGERGRALFQRLRGGEDRAGRHVLTQAFQASHAEALTEPFASGTTRARQIAFATSPAKVWLADPLPQWNMETRDPLADRHLIECLLGYPLDALTVGNRGRGLARAMGAGRVPDIIRFRRTRGEQMSEVEAIIAAHSKAYRQALETVAASAAFRGIVDIDLLKNKVDRVCEARGNRVDAITVDRALDVGLFVSTAAT
ncbi:MAG TPA: asparagine synthase-related protein [Rhizomicrobium sp.]